MSSAICSICNSPRSDSVGPCAVCGAPPAVPARNLPVGTHLQNSKFSLGRVLGEGGFGITYLGAHRHLQRTVAIKELFPERAMRHGTTVSVPDSQQRDFHMEKERVLEEARALTRLDSPHIVEVQDAFLENNTAYIVMEYLEGESLQERIDTVGSLPPDDVRRIAMAACDALAEVHRQDLLHRDIKPANIMLTRDERVVLVDFGSARSFNHGQTVRHTRILTMDYAAPEMYSIQARFGPYTDLFCLGGTLYHALTGRQPPSVMDRLQDPGIDLEFPDAVQGPLSAAIRQTLQIAVAARPQSSADFKRDCLETVVPVASTHMKPAVPVKRTWKSTSQILTLRGHRTPVQAMEFSPDGQLLACICEYDESVRLWDVKTGSVRHELKHHIVERQGWPLWAGFGSDGQTLATGDSRRIIRIWDVHSGGLRHTFDKREFGAASRFALSADTCLLASWSRGRRDVYLYRMDTGGLMRTLEGPGPGAGVANVAFNSDGSLLAGVDGNLRVLYVWSTETGTLVRVLRSNLVFNVAISPNGRTVAGYGPVSIQLWDVDTGTPLASVMEPDDYEIDSLWFSDDGRTLVSFVDHLRNGRAVDTVIRLRDADNDTLLPRSTIHCVGDTMAMAIGRNGILACGGSGTDKVTLWDLGRGNRVHTLTGQDWKGVHSVQFSPDGQRLACGDGHGAVHLWDMAAVFNTGWVDGDSGQTRGHLSGRAGGPGPGPQLSLKATTVNLNVRSGPGMGHIIVGRLPRDSTNRYDILGKNAAMPPWYQICLSSTVTGWVPSVLVQTHGDLSGLAVTYPAPASGPQLSLKATIATGLNVRSGPDTAHRLVGTIPRGATTRYDILGKNAAKPTWYQIRLSSTVAGWVYRAFVQTRGDLSGLAVTWTPTNPAQQLSRPHAVLGKRPTTSAPGPQLSLKATTVNLNVRSGPGMGHSIVGRFPRDSTNRYDILGKDAVFPTWWQIQYSNTITGWVVANYYVQTHGDISGVPIR